MTNQFIKAHLPTDSRFKPVLKARYWGGLNGTKIPEELKPFIKKHVSTTSNGQQYIKVYNDSHYYRIFAKSRPEIVDFPSFFAVIKPYFRVLREQKLT